MSCRHSEGNSPLSFSSADTDELLSQELVSGCTCSPSTQHMRALHIENLPLTITAQKLADWLSVFGKVQYCEAAPELLRAERGAILGRRVHCYVVFTTHADACYAKHKLLELLDQLGCKDQQTLRVRFAKPQHLVPSCTPSFRAFVAAQWLQAAAVAKVLPDDLKRPPSRVNALFISKLHQRVTNPGLRAVFGRFGPLLACEVQYHSDGRSAGHGVVIYDSVDDAERSLAALNNSKIEGRAIEVTPLRLKKLPSKLEHLKNMIKREPCPLGAGEDGGEGSEGSCGEGGCGGAVAPPPGMLPPGAGCGSNPAATAAATAAAVSAIGAAAAAAMAGVAPPGVAGPMPFPAITCKQEILAAAVAAAAAGEGPIPLGLDLSFI